MMNRTVVILAVGVLAVAAAAFLLLRERDASDVFRSIQSAGYPVVEGRPGDSQYAAILDNNSCASSKGFVRRDATTGWAIICVRPPADAYRRLMDQFSNVPLMVGPLLVNDRQGAVVIFGFGWPLDSSEKFYQAIGGTDGSYLRASSY